MPIDISQAAAAVNAGQLIAYPTEAVYGLGCAADKPAALERLMALKSRDSNKGLILVACDWRHLSPYVAELSDEQIAPAKRSWPGPVTWIVPASCDTHPLLTGGRKTLAVRISAHPVVNALCKASNQAIVSTSANTSGQPPLGDEASILNAFGENIAGVVEGKLGALQKPTSIFDLTTGTQLR